MASKIGILTLVGSLCASAAGLGIAMAPEETVDKMQVPKLRSGASAPQRYDGDLSGLPSSGQGIPNSLYYVKGSPDGKTRAQRAQEAEAARAKAQAEQEAALAAAEAAPPDPNAGAMDPAAMAAAADGQVQPGAAGSSTFAKKFGQLSKSLGGSGLAGGSGMAGGIGRGFDTPKIDSGKLARLSSGAQASRTTARLARATPSQGKGKASRQLSTANQYARFANKASGEGSSTLSAAVFDNPAQSNNVIAGQGATSTQAQPDADATTNPNASGPMGGGEESDDLSGGGGAPAPGEGKSVDKADRIIKILKILCGIAAVLLTLLTALYLLLEAGVVLAPWVLTAITVVRIALIGLGAAILGLGIALATMDKVVLGLMYSGVGALVGILAYTGYGGVTGSILVDMAGSALIAGVMPYLTQGMAKK